MKKFEPIQIYTFIGIAFVGILAVALAIWVLRIQNLLTQFTQDHITRNNLISKENIEEPVLEGLKPQIINIKGEKYTLYIPDIFTASIVSDVFDAPQRIQGDDQGNLFVTDAGTNSLWILPKSNINEPKKVDTNIPGIYDIVWDKGKVYISTDTKIIRYTDIQSDGSYQSRDTLIDNLPKTDSDTPHTIAINNDTIYVAVAANCETCKPKDSRRASILSFDMDGKNEKLFAKGLKQVTDMLVEQNNLLVTDIGRQGIANGIPRVEMNQIEQGKDYGWPYCYSFDSVDPKYPNQSEFCKSKAEAPIFEMPQGNGISSFARTSDRFYPEFQDTFTYVYSGEKRNSIPKGYKVVIKDTNNPAKNLITGWLNEDGQIWGSPSGITFGINGDIFITDSMKGVVYRIERKP